MLLIQPPFLSIWRPSLGLTNIATTLRAAGHDVEVLYANLTFSELVGPDAYSLVADRLPVQLLAGDLAFSCELGRSAPSDQLDETVFRLVYDNFGPSLHDSGKMKIAESIIAARRQAPLLVEEVAQIAAAGKYDLIGLSAIFQVVPALALASGINSSAPGVPLILGGSHCEGPMGMALHKQFSFLDFVARGEGEQLIANLAGNLAVGEPSIERIAGLIWRDSGGISRANGDQGASPDLDSIPAPTYEDWLLQRFSGQSKPDLSSVMLPVETSRGCWYGERKQCVFCGLNGKNIAFRSKSPQVAVRDLEHVGSYGAGSVNATDNIIDAKYFDSTLAQLAGRSSTYNIFYEVKSNISEPQMKRLAEAGVRTIQPGIESLSTPVLQRMKKGVRAVQNVRTLRLAAEYRVGVTWNLLYGFSGDTLADYVAMIDLVRLIPHLYPPVFESNRIRADRFSPMFDSPAEYQLSKLRPAPGYAEAFAGLGSELSQNFLDNVAYYFDYDVPPDQEAEHARIASRLNPEVQRWHSAFGHSVLGSIERDGRRVIVDRRSSEPSETELDEHETIILSVLDQGADLEVLTKKTRIAASDILTVLSLFVDRGWCVKLDGRFISLIVRLDGYVPESIPEALRARFAAEYYMSACRAYWAEVAEVQQAVSTK